MLKNFTKDIGSLLRYGKTHFINLEKMHDPENTFVLPMFMKPGRTHFMLRTPEDSMIKAKKQNRQRYRILPYQIPEDVQYRFYYNRHIIPFREERVPGCKYSIVSL